MNVYGPVPSRRLGRSLGVDPLPREKTCTMSCVYCQLGRTRRMTLQREEFVPLGQLLAQLREAAKRGGFDWISVVGSGEPTLYSRLGELVRAARELGRVAVITNGSLLWREDVLSDVVGADLVLPTLSAGTERAYRRLHRPHRELSLTRHLEGLLALRREAKGQIWLEVMLVAGVNDTEEELAALREHIRKIKPDRVHINVPVRPPAEAWVKIPKKEALLRAQEVLGGQLLTPKLIHVEPQGDLRESILGITRRHPMTRRELEYVLGENDLAGVLAEMESEGLLIEEKFMGDTYYRAK